MFTSSEAFASIVPAAPNPGQVIDLVTRREASGLFTSRYLVKRPYATNDLQRGIYQTPRETALTMRYIQANPRPLSYCMVLDIDHPDALTRAFRSDLPRPSWVAQSPSGKAHAGYLLANPFHTEDPAQRKALRLAARVEEGLRRELDADPGYSGLMTKNPLHGDWDTKWGPDALHTLAQMAAELGTNLPAPSVRKPRGDVAGLGRNCLLFEQTRVWAYSAVRRYWGDGLPAFRHAVEDHLTVLNAQLAVPLGAVEVAGIASSIAHWTWATMTPEGFKAAQTRRSAKGAAKSVEVRSARAREREQAVLQLRAEGHRWQAIADTLGMSMDAAKAIGRRAKRCH
jgi:hypothetical protein